MSVNTTDKKAINKWFRQLMATDATLTNRDANDAYYKEEAEFKTELTAFISDRGNMLALTGTQILHICRMVSRYRPMALHTFLIYCAREVEHP